MNIDTIKSTPIKVQLKNTLSRQDLSTSTLVNTLSPSPSKKYLPSRHLPKEVLLSSVNLSKASILNQVESNMITLDNQCSKMDSERLKNRIKEMQSYHPINQTKKSIEFKKKPIKRTDLDLLMYKEIFVEPKEKILNELKDKERVFEELLTKAASKPSEKTLNSQNNNNNSSSLNRSTIQTDPNLANITSPIKLDDNLDSSQIHLKRVNMANLDYTARSVNLSELKNTKNINSMSTETLNISSALSPEIQLTQTIPSEDMPNKNIKHQNERTFFEQQIQVQPPETPNFSTASPLAPGNGWAQSIPLIKIDTSKKNVKDLLVRAKAGMQAGDVQKEAHLAFYLGMVHETNKSYKQAIKYYKKYFNCAQSLEDRIGMTLALNRIGINYFTDEKPEKSLEFHLKNLELSEKENSFAGFYNLGITYRTLSRFNEALNAFNDGLSWAKNYKDIESECLCYGQLGVTYLDMKQYKDSFDLFKECYEISVQLKNTKLQLDSLMHMSKISNYISSSQAEALEIYKNAYACAKDLGDKKTKSLCLCNMGILEGSKKFEQFVKNFKLPINDDDEDNNNNNNTDNNARPNFQMAN